MSEIQKLTFKRTYHAFVINQQDFPPCLCSKLSLLRVLHVYQLYFSEYPEMIFKLVNLRYLAIRVQGLRMHEQTDVMHNNISKLKKLQTLIVEMISIAVIVDLPQLRYLKANCGIYTNEFPYERISGPHENLQSTNLMTVDILMKLCGKLPNLRRLRMGCGKPTFGDNDMTSFHKLETLSLSAVKSFPNIIFPDSLKKLRLSCNITQFLLDAIGRLPNLQILKFVSCVFENSTWEPTEGEFLNLRYLEICATRLKNWLATQYHFPAL